MFCDKKPGPIIRPEIGQESDVVPSDSEEKQANKIYKKFKVKNILTFRGD